MPRTEPQPRADLPLHIGIDASRMAIHERTGTERYSYELIAALAQINRRDTITLYTNGLPSHLPRVGPNVRLRSIPLPRLWTHARLGPAARQDRVDLLFVPAHVVPAFHPPACVVTLHDLGYLHFPEAHTRRRRLELDFTTRWSLRAARQIIAISHATRADLIRHYQADPTRISVVHHGVQPSFRPATPTTIATLRQQYALPHPYLLYVGTIQPRKNLARLISAFAQLCANADLPAELQLVLAGKPGWLTESITTQAAQLGIAQRVRFLGYVPEPDLPALLSGALAFCFPSLYEGFGMPVLEAMACGTPVLCANTAALPEVAGDAALCVDPLDTAAISAGLRQLVDDATLRERLRQAGIAHAAQFTWERCARETLAVLHAAAERAG
jgi:glycosyltransferase involved in cell wall biosynthesis